MTLPWMCERCMSMFLQKTKRLVRYCDIGHFLLSSKFTFRNETVLIMKYENVKQVAVKLVIRGSISMKNSLKFQLVQTMPSIESVKESKFKIPKAVKSVAHKTKPIIAFHSTSFI